MNIKKTITVLRRLCFVLAAILLFFLLFSPGGLAAIILLDFLKT